MLGGRRQESPLSSLPFVSPMRKNRTLDDESALPQIVCLGEVIDRCTPTFLVAPAFVVVGEVQRKGTGSRIKDENALAGFDAL
jgi:hypothetical protein